MTIAYLGSTAFASGSSTNSSASFDSTGANLIVVTTQYWNGNPGAPTDNKGNTYTALTTRGSAYALQIMYYCVNPTVGTGHIITQASSGASNNVSTSVGWFSGVATSSPLDGESGGGTLSGSITPSQNDCLVVFAAADYYLATGPTSVSGGFTKVQDYISAAPDEPACLAYLIQTTAAAATPTWTFTGTSVNQVHSIAVFKAGSADTTAPVLTTPTGTATGSSTATVGATTDEGNGTMYAVVTTSATQPSVAQLKAGQDHTGAAAAWGGSVAVSSTGAKTLNATGLTASTTYYGHVVHTDAATNDSNRVSSSSFTTSAPPTITTAAFKNNAGYLQASATIDNVVVLRASNRTLTLALTAQTTDASGILTIANAALTSGVDYLVVSWNTGLTARGCEIYTAS